MRKDTVSREKVTDSTWIIYRGRDAVGTVQRWPVIPEGKKFIAQLRGGKVPLGEYPTLAKAESEIIKAL